MPPRKKFNALLERVHITEDLRQQVLAFAEQNSLTVSHIQRAALRAYLTAQAKRAAKRKNTSQDE